MSKGVTCSLRFSRKSTELSCYVFEVRPSDPKRHLLGGHCHTCEEWTDGTDSAQLGIGRTTNRANVITHGETRT